MKTLTTLSLLLIFNLGIAQTTITIDHLTKYKKFSNEQTDLSKGEKLLGVFNTNCDHCQETATKLGQYSNSKTPKVYALFYNEIEEIGPKEFSDNTNTNYPYIIIGDDDFWTLLKNSPPIIYHLKDGKVIQYFEGENIAERINEYFK